MKGDNTITAVRPGDLFAFSKGVIEMRVDALKGNRSVLQRWFESACCWQPIGQDRWRGEIPRIRVHYYPTPEN